MEKPEIVLDQEKDGSWTCFYNEGDGKSFTFIKFGFANPGYALSSILGDIDFREALLLSNLDIVVIPTNGQVQRISLGPK
jgi:hypothetical protein